LITKSIRLGEVVSYIRGITFKPEDVCAPGTADSVICMRTKNIQADLDESDLIAVDQRFARREEQMLGEGDILISSANSWNLVGKSVYVPKLSYRATAGGFISIVRADTSMLDPRYLYHWITTDKTQAKIRRCGRQTTNISNLSSSQFLDLEIPLPALGEQKRITAILDKADSLRRKRQQATRLADDFLRAVFLDMFGDPVTNPKGWPVGTIRDLVASANYGSSEKADEIEGQYPILRMNNLTYEGRLDLSSLKYVDLDDKVADKYLARKGDLLFNRTNSKELVGKTAVYDRDETMAIAGYLIRVRMNEKGNPCYVSAYLNSAHGKATLQAMCKPIVGMANINAQEMQNIRIMLPPIDLQDHYANVVEKMRATEKTFSQSGEVCNKLIAALSTNFLS